MYIAKYWTQIINRVKAFPHFYKLSKKSKSKKMKKHAFAVSQHRLVQRLDQIVSMEILTKGSHICHLKRLGLHPNPFFYHPWQRKRYHSLQLLIGNIFGFWQQYHPKAFADNSRFIYIYILYYLEFLFCKTFQRSNLPKACTSPPVSVLHLFHSSDSVFSVGRGA